MITITISQFIKEQINNLVEKINQTGLIHFILLAIVGLLAFILISNTFSFRDTIFQQLFPKPNVNAKGSSFVTRSNGTLMVDGQPFRFAGANIPWLGLDDYDNGAYPSHYRIDDAFKTVQEMGGTVVRSHTLGISVGCSICLKPNATSYNDQAFESIDYAIKSAADHNIRLIIPLVDNWQHYLSGGKYKFAEWAGVPEEQFYTNAQAKQDFKNYIAYLLNHVNQYTGVALKDAPTILAWETGNELYTAPAAWTQEMAAYIKSLAPNHPERLVSDGHSASYNGDPGGAVTLTTDQLSQSSVDMYSGHFYPINSSIMLNAANLAKQYNKVYFVGEHDWLGISGATPQATASLDSSIKQSGNNSLRVDVTQAAQLPLNIWHVQAFQNGITLNQGQSYTLTFYAKASQNRAIGMIFQKSTSPYTEYYRNDSINITTDWQPYTVTFTAPVSEANAHFSFNMANATGQVWLDNISLSSGGTNIPLQNPSFEDATWPTPPWYFKVVNPQADTLNTFLSNIETASNGVSGDFFWQLASHKDNYGFSAADWFNLEYPGPDQAKKDKVQLLRTHGFAMKGITPPPAASTPEAPLLHPVTRPAGGGAVISWRGVAGADKYNVERSTDGNNWTTVGSNLTDYNPPWTDSSAQAGVIYKYRVKAFNTASVAGPYSNLQPPNDNLVSDPSFENTANFYSTWYFKPQPPSSIASIALDSTDKQEGNKSARITVDQATPNSWWDIQLSQQGIALAAGATYNVSFYAKANVLPGTTRSMIVILQKNGPTDFTEYTRQTFNLTSSWQQYTFNYTAASTDPTALFDFNFGQATGTVWLDNISISNNTSQCNPRPLVQVTVTPNNPKNNRLNVSVTATANAGFSNSISRIDFTSITDITQGSNQVNSWVEFPNGVVIQSAPPTQTYGPPQNTPTNPQTFVVVRDAKKSVTVVFTVVDQCGNWPTFAGGGNNAF